LIGSDCTGSCKSNYHILNTIDTDGLKNISTENIICLILHTAKK